MSEAADLNSRIKELMERHGWSVAEMARECGIARGSLEKYLRGDAKPGFDSIVKICRRSGVSPNWLILGKEMDKNALYETILLSSVNSAHEMLQKVRELIALDRTPAEIDNFLSKEGTFSLAFHVARPWVDFHTDVAWKKISDPMASDT